MAFLLELGHSDTTGSAMTHDANSHPCCPQHHTSSSPGLDDLPCSLLGGLSMPLLPRCRPAAGGAINPAQLPRAETVVSSVLRLRQPSPHLQVRHLSCLPKPLIRPQNTSFYVSSGCKREGARPASRWLCPCDLLPPVERLQPATPGGKAWRGKPKLLSQAGAGSS